MKKYGCTFALLLVLGWILAGCHGTSEENKPLLKGAYWKDQAINQIIPGWTINAPDRDSGAFITNMGARWNPLPDFHKYPGMIGRHIFSYSSAYLMTGNDEYLDMAKSAKNFLLEHAWDTLNGGWYDMLNRDGTPAATTRNMFFQTYTLTGLTMYYFVTRDPDVLRYIEKTDSLLVEHIWDKVTGGYFNAAADDWSIIDSDKSLASQVAPVSGYLLYLYLATRDIRYLNRSLEIMTCVMKNMKNKESGWILEYFDRNWNKIDSRNEFINTGHNIETAWVLLRLNMLRNSNKIPPDVSTLEDSLFTYAYNDTAGFWYTELEMHNNKPRNDWTYWWIQAYGNMYSLCSYRLSGNTERLKQFVTSAQFWDKHFIDRVYGDTYTSVSISGDVKDSTKANPYKTSYHSIEQCLLNYLYLRLWIENKPVTLHFSLVNPRDGDLLYPVPIEDQSIVIENAEYEAIAGKEKPVFNNQSVILKESPATKIKVEIRCKRH